MLAIIGVRTAREVFKCMEALFKHFNFDLSGVNKLYFSHYALLLPPRFKQWKNPIEHSAVIIKLTLFLCSELV
jgi:hypothetical protein